jgi:hypothetical protein
MGVGGRRWAVAGAWAAAAGSLLLLAGLVRRREDPGAAEAWATELLGAGGSERAHRVFVNCESGSDKTGDGSRKRPFLSPMHARDFLRTMAPYTSFPVEVLVYGDCFPRNPKGAIDFSHSVLELRPGLDSGTRRAPISYIGGKRSRFLSGLPIDKSAWKSVNEHM